MSEKVYYNQVEMIAGKGIGVKMPRTAIIPVVNDPEYGLNAGAVSAGVISTKPLQVIFGVKSWDSKLTYHDAKEFVVAVPRRDQIDNMWVTACSVPKGINEIELAGWTELPSRQIGTPGIAECPLNLECKKAHMIQLKQPMRLIIIGDVVGVSIDTDLLDLSRSEVVRKFPMHEATDNRYTRLYGPSVLSGELIPSAEPPQPFMKKEGAKTFVSKADLYNPEYEAVLMNAIFPMPSYILVSLDEGGNANGFPVSGGLLMAAPVSVQVPILKNSFSYKNIKRTGEFVYSIPLRHQISNFEKLEKNLPDGFKVSGLTLERPNQVKTPGIKECVVNVDCKVWHLDDVPGTDYAIIVADRVGMSIDREHSEYASEMDLYCQYPYAVMDRGMVRKWGFHDTNNLTVKPLPSWGSRYHGGWWTGPEQYQAGMQFWLLELVMSGYLSEEEYFKIRHWMGMFRREGYQAPEPLWSELKKKLTTVLKMMVWAHRDYDKWREVHDYLAQFASEGRWWAP